MLSSCHEHTRRVGGRRIERQRGRKPPFLPHLCPKSHLFEHRATGRAVTRGKSLETFVTFSRAARGKGWDRGWARGKEPGLSGLPMCRLLPPAPSRDWGEEKRKERGKKIHPVPSTPPQASPQGCGCVPARGERGDTPLPKPPVFQLRFSSF